MAALISYLFYFVAATASPLQRRHLAIRRINDKGQLDFAFRVMLITLLLSPVLMIFKRPVIKENLIEIILLAIVCGIFGAVSIGLQYIAQRHVEAGLTSLVNNLYTPTTIILASLFLHESLKPLQIFGTLILLLSVVLVSNKHRLSKWNFDRYFWLMVVSGISLGAVLSAERALIKNNGITSGTWISWGSQTIFLALMALLARTKSQYDLKDTAVTGLVRFPQQISWVVLVTIVGNLSLVSAVTTFKIVLIFVTAAIFLKEREDLKRKVVGSFIAVVGLLLMA